VVFFLSHLEVINGLSFRESLVPSIRSHKDYFLGQETSKDNRVGNLETLQLQHLVFLKLRMNSSKNSNHGSLLANGKKIRDLRCLLGLTQLELAMKVDCSERLIRKMEKRESVSVKSLSFLYVFFRAQGIEVGLNDLIYSPSNALEIAEQWFRERFIDHNNQADQKWFSEQLSLSSSTASKLKVLQKFAQASGISLGMAMHHDQNVVINFHITRDKPSQDPSGSVWLKLTSGKISRLHVILDSEFEKDESENLGSAHNHKLLA